MTHKIKIANKFKKLTNKEKAKKMGVSIKTVVKYFSQDREDYIKSQALRRAEMYKLKCDGLSLSEIGKKYGTTRHNVSLLIKKHKEQYANQLTLI